MTKKQGTLSITEYQGKPVVPARELTFDYDVYDNLTEAKGSEDWPSDNEVLKIINQRSMTRSRASVYQKETADLKAAHENTREFKVANFIKSALAAKLFGGDEAQIRALAESQIPQ